MPAALHALPVLASDAAFFALFGVFVVAILVLIVLTIRWVFRRDRALRSAWRQRRIDSGVQPYGIVPKGSADDGTPPAPRT
jgi:hypothetical protein